MARKWNPSLRELYTLLGPMLQTDLDVDRIERVRPEVADLIRKNGGEHNPDLDVFVAAKTGHRAVVERFLAAGGDIEARDPGNYTMLILAAALGQTDIGEFLIEKGADIDATYDQGSTALHAAAALGQREVVGLLLEKGADANLKNGKGETALEMVTAPWTRDMEIEYGSAGHVLQHLFDVEKIKKGRPEMVALLRQHEGEQ